MSKINKSCKTMMAMPIWVTSSQSSIQMLLDEGIPFKYFRVDTASYQKEVIRQVEQVGAYLRLVK
jgi:hypothetical protein